MTTEIRTTVVVDDDDEISQDIGVYQSTSNPDIAYVRIGNLRIEGTPKDLLKVLETGLSKAKVRMTL